MSQPANATTDPHRRAWNMLLAVQVALFVALGCYCTLSQRYLFADGSHFLLDLLEDQIVTDFFPARYYAHLLTQLPAVVALQYFQCRDVGLIGLIYGATQFLSPVAGLLLTWWAARGAPVRYLAFPMLSQSIIYLNTSFVMFCEIHPATWLFWCILYLLMFSQRFTVTRSVLLIALGVLATRTYENYLFLAWPLVYAACCRGWSCWAAHRYAEASICGVSGLLAVVSAAVALYSTIFPFDAVNRSNFAMALFGHIECLPVRFSIVMISLALWQALQPRLSLGKAVWFCAIVYGCFVAVAPLFGYYEGWWYQYVARVQSLYIPLLFGGLVALNPPILRDDSSSSEVRDLGLWKAVALTCAVSIIFQFTATLRWNEYRIALLQELAKDRGVIAYTDAADRPKEFDWGWTMPSVSIALSALNGSSISTIICNEDPSGWQPFDPTKTEQMSYLRQYGISIDLENRQPGKRPADIGTTNSVDGPR